MKEVHNVGSMRGITLQFEDAAGWQVVFEATDDPVWPYDVWVSEARSGYYPKMRTTKRRPNATHAQRMKLQAIEAYKAQQKEQAAS